MGELQAWGDGERKSWFDKQSIKRSYKEHVQDPISEFKDRFSIVQYGSLSIDPPKYPLYLIQPKAVNKDRPLVLVTGGVHGYETSGVTGALEVARSLIEEFTPHFNLFVAPCVSPWGFETINRWNPGAVDPNRSFIPNSPSEEASFLMDAIYGTEKNYGSSFLVHIDLHETTDTDKTIFRPALAARDGREDSDKSEIPDGFYLVGDSGRQNPEFQKAMIDAVRQVTHIAPADAKGQLIGVNIEQEGVINYDCKGLGLCAGMTDARYVTTTEVYPDSPGVSEEECKKAQVQAVVSGLNYVKKNHS